MHACPVRRRCSGASVLAFALTLACGDDGSTPSASSTGGEGTTGSIVPSSSSTSTEAGDDATGDSSSGTSGEPPSSEPTAEQWERLLALRYDEGPVPADVTNAWADDPAAAALGQALFFDPRFSGPLLDGDNDGSEGTLGADGETHRVACASCHVPEDGFVDTRSPHQQISLAAGWVLRRTPTLLDVGFATLLGWGGRRDTMHGLLFGVVENTRELNSSRLYFAQQLARNHRDAYEDVFGPMPAFDDPRLYPALAPEDAGCPELDAPAQACSGRPGDAGPFDALDPDEQEAVTRAVVNAGKAIGAYLRQLRCGPSAFDAWLDGDDDALTEVEKRGAIVFVSTGGCDECHAGPRLSDLQFHNVGLIPQTVATVFVDLDDFGASDDLAAVLADPLNSMSDYSDGYDGRLPRAVTRADIGAFKTPSLRCIADHPSFMHTGHFDALEDVMKFFRRGGDPGGYPGTSELQPLDLGDDDLAALVAFMGALQGAGPDASLTEPP